MNAKRKMFFYQNHQHGGMLMELMLAVAISAVLIPFIFRYQKNTIERARNIAVVKQMEIVQKALEKCIESNRLELMKPVSQHYVYTEGSECLMLTDGTGQHGLIKYGLNENFANDYKDDYVLRILLKKKIANSDTGVLQGVVLLQQDGITAMRTREIVDVGGGKLGYTKDDTVYGGFNSFETTLNNLGLSKMNGVVGITSAIRRAVNNQYLWRVPTDAGADSTMLSDLDINGNNITNISNLTGKDMSFDFYTVDTVATDKAKIESNTLTFNEPVTITSCNIGEHPYLSAIMNPGENTTCSLKGVDSNASLSISDSSKFNGSLYCTEYTTQDLTIKNNVIVNKFGSCRENTECGQNTKFSSYDKDINIASIKADDVIVSNSVSLPKLTVKCIAPTDSTKTDYYYNVSQNGCNNENYKASFYDVHIKKLGKVMKAVYEEEHNRCSGSGCLRINNYYIDEITENYLVQMIGASSIEKDIIWEEKTVYQYLEVLQKIQRDIESKLINEL